MTMARSGDFYTLPQIYGLITGAGQFVHVSDEKIYKLLRNYRLALNETVWKLMIDNHLKHPVYEINRVLSYLQARHGIICHICGRVQRGEITTGKDFTAIFPSTLMVENYPYPSPLCYDCLIPMIQRFRYGQDADLDFTARLAGVIQMRSVQDRIVKYKSKWKNLRFDPRRPK